MSDYTLPPRSTLIVGMTGSGKSTFAFLALENQPASCRFVFDDLGQAAARLHRPHASTAAELEAALATRWVIFNPHRMFPRDLNAAFRFFCQWTYDCCQRSNGHKVLLIDEAWRFQSPQGIPQELAMCAVAGRAEDLELMICTQMPHRVHASITGAATEAVFFKLQERLALDRCEELGCERETIAGLERGRFVALNRMNGQQVTGRVF